MSNPAPDGAIVIVGAGLAGLFTALKLAPLPVTLITPAPLGEAASSAWAQGGIAAAVGEGDTPAQHAADTIAAGAGIVEEAVARLVAEEARARVEDLLAYGVPFDRDLAGHLALSREAAHSQRRIVRVAGDRAGRAIMEALIATVRRTPSVRILEGFAAHDITMADGRVAGLVVSHAGDGAHLYRLQGIGALVLATGGIGGLYAVTTNPAHSRGEAIAMAARAGATIADAEFVQFHPTAIDVGRDPAPLATEALRGEGAILVDRDGGRFMPGVHPDAELAPRDIVARAVFRRIEAGDGAFLDCRQAVGARFPEAFPTVHAACAAAGIDPVRDPIPVAPAEHYHMGGVRTDLEGRTGVPGLYAVGEAAATGLHGANRLASNSLIEAVVFGARAAARIAGEATTATTHAPAPAEAGADASDLGARAAAIAELRQTMSRFVGVERNEAGLRAALVVIRRQRETMAGDRVVANMALAAHFIAEAALRRKESRGSHFRSDWPGPGEGLAKRSFMTLAGLELRGGDGARGVLSQIVAAGRLVR